MWRGFVSAQVAGSLVLLVTALLFVRTVRSGESARIGFDPEGIVVAPLVSFSLLGLEPDVAATRFAAWIERIEQDPGVDGAALVRNVPLGLRGAGSTTVSVDGVTPPPGSPGFETRFTAATPGYFDVMRIPVLGGRSFDERDGGDAPRVAVVSQAFARRYWPGESPIGRSVTRNGGESIEVVGMVGDVSLSRAEQAPSPYLYLSFAQWPTRDGDLVVRERVPGAAATAIVGAARTLIPDLPLSSPLPLARHIGITLLPQRIAATVGGVLGGLGALLAGLGVYGLLAFTFAQRRREIGVRLAVGAGRSDIGRIVLGEALRMAAVGIVIGTAASFAVARAVGSMLHGVSTVDPVAFAGGAALVACVAVVGSLVPARRALATDPIVALRAD
jgi:predicted permease